MTKVHPDSKTGEEPLPKKSKLDEASALSPVGLNVQWRIYIIVGAVTLTITIIIAIIFFTLIVLQVASEHRVFVYVIWRHGDRAPSKILKGIPVAPNAFPNGLGQMTDLGVEQAKDLGRKLSIRYFTSETPLDRIYVILTCSNNRIRSTNVTRTIKTAENVINGMGFHVNIIHDTPMSQDTEANPFYRCLKAKQIEKRLRKEGVFFRKEDYKHVYDILKERINFTGYAYEVFDQLFCMSSNHIPVPEWSKNDTLMEELKMLSWHGLEASFGLNPVNTLMRKLRGGSILRGVIERLKEQKDCYASDAKAYCTPYFYGLSAHDITIAALISTFPRPQKVLGEHPMIGYTANLAFELWQIGKALRLKVLYANSYRDEPVEITRFVPGCIGVSGSCKLDNFLTATEPLIFSNPLEQCENEKSKRRGKRHIEYFTGNLVEYMQS